MLFFSKRADLQFLCRYRPEAPCVDYQNVDSFIAVIIAEGKATLQELRTIYSLEDAFTLWETIVVPRYNEYLAIEHAKKKRGGD